MALQRGLGRGNWISDNKTSNAGQPNVVLVPDSISSPRLAECEGLTGKGWLYIFLLWHFRHSWLKQFRGAFSHARFQAARATKKCAARFSKWYRMLCRQCCETSGRRRVARHSFEDCLAANLFVVSLFSFFSLKVVGKKLEEVLTKHHCIVRFQSKIPWSNSCDANLSSSPFDTVCLCLSTQFPKMQQVWLKMPRKRCRYWTGAQGSCGRGDACMFAHEAPPSAPSCSTSETSYQDEARSYVWIWDI